ncbi:hypothetical protein AWZ03_015439, partial [Drosophila navojoa]
DAEYHNPGLSVGWIYQRCKEELITIARVFGLNGEGRVEDLRKRLSTFIQSNNYSAEAKARLAEIEKHFAKGSEFTLGGNAPSMGSRANQKSEPDLRKVLEQGLVQTESLKLRVPMVNSAAVRRREERKEFINTGEDEALSTTSKTGQQVRAPAIPSERSPAWGVAEQVRKWDMRYDGRRDPLGFVEILEERAITYGIGLDQMPRAMS